MRLIRKIIFVIVGICFICIKSYDELYAGIEDMKHQLPVIVYWKDGNGYTMNNVKLTDTWAYDSLNPAGKYVLFGLAGEVINKVEQMEEQNDIGESFTDTCQSTRELALRAEIYKGFHGTVKVVLQRENADFSMYELNEDNQYGLNIPLTDGKYSVTRLTADDGKQLYEVKYSTLNLEEEKEFYLLKFYVKNILVGEEKIDEMKEGNDEPVLSQLVEKGNISDDKKIDSEGKAKQSQKHSLLWIISVSIIVVAVVILKRKENKYQ